MNNTYPHPVIIRGGWPYLGGISTVTLIVQAAAGFGRAWPFWVLTLLVLQFFRDSVHTVPTQVNAILSPADGRIVVVEQVRDPYADRDVLRISVFMNVFNVHSNRALVDGTVQQMQYFPGKFANADLGKASLENECNAIVLRRADGQFVTSVQVTGLVARHILCYTEIGEALVYGQRYGPIRFGLRADVYLPLTACPHVTIGEKVSAMLTVFAEPDWSGGCHACTQPT